MSSIIDFSTIIVAFAILGFIFKNVFYKTRELNVPYELKNQEDRYFSYISNALLILSYIWIFVALYLSKNPPSNEEIEPFLKPLFGLVDIGLLTENEIGDYIKNAFLIIYVLTIFSPLYLTAYGFVFIWGRIAEMFDEQSVKVILKDDKTESKEYKRIIAESSDFIYFETLNDIRKWEGIRKNDISSLERAVTKSKFSNRVFNLLKDKTYWKNREKRKKVAMVLIASFIILIGVSIFFSTPILSYAITTNATLLALILLIENSFLNLKSKD